MIDHAEFILGIIRDFEVLRFLKFFVMAQNYSEVNPNVCKNKPNYFHNNPRALKKIGPKGTLIRSQYGYFL